MNAGTAVDHILLGSGNAQRGTKRRQRHRSSSRIGRRFPMDDHRFNALARILVPATHLPTTVTVGHAR